MNNNELNNNELNNVVEETTMNNNELAPSANLDVLKMQILELSAQIEALKAKGGITASDSVKKNHKVGVPSPTAKYVLLSNKLENWGKVPQQQQDIADILINNMEVNVPYTEAQVFNMLVSECGEYLSLCNSKQDVTYLFKYYRGLKKIAKHAGFIARNFIQKIG